MRTGINCEHCQPLAQPPSACSKTFYPAVESTHTGSTPHCHSPGQPVFNMKQSVSFNQRSHTFAWFYVLLYILLCILSTYLLFLYTPALQARRLAIYSLRSEPENKFLLMPRVFQINRILPPNSAHSSVRDKSKDNKL